MALRNQPYIPLYVQDFLTDEKLLECSSSSIGIYIMIMCVMHKSKDYGTILLKQKNKQSDNQINNFACKLGKHLPFTTTEIQSALTELINEDVLQLEDDILSQKRMIHDNELSIKRSIAGKIGGKKTQFAKAKTQANSESEYENENENRDINKDGTELEIWPTFEDFWKLYDKKVGSRDKCKRKFDKLKQEEKENIMNHIFDYVKSTPEKQYRKNPITYLDGKSWNDEIILNTNNNGQKQGFSQALDKHLRDNDPDYKNY